MRIARHPSPRAEDSFLWVLVNRKMTEDRLIDLNGKEIKEVCLWLLDPFLKWGGGGVDDKTVGMGITVLSGSKCNKRVSVCVGLNCAVQVNADTSLTVNFAVGSCMSLIII